MGHHITTNHKIQSAVCSTAFYYHNNIYITHFLSVFIYHYCHCSVETKPNVNTKSVRSFKGISVQNVEKLVMRKIFYQKCA